MTSSRFFRPRLFLLSTAIAVAVSLAGAQTRITAPKNKYTPEQDVELGREAAAEIRKQYPVITDSALSGYLDRLGKRLVAVAPAELNNPVFEVLVHAGEPEGHQRLRAARRPDVRQPRDVRGGCRRGRGRRRDGARAEPRAVAPRHRQRNQSRGLSARSDRRRNRRRRRRWRVGPGHLAGQPVRARYGDAEIQPRVRKASGPARRANHGASGLQPARSGPHVRDDPEGVARRRAAVAEQPSRSGQPLGLHRERSRDASGDATRDLRRRVSAGPRTLCGVAAGQDHGRNGARERRQRATAGWRVCWADWRPRSGTLVAVPDRPGWQRVRGRAYRRTGRRCRRQTP